MLSLIGILSVVSTILLSSSSGVAARALDPVNTGLHARQSATASGYAQPSSWLTVIPGSNLGEPINIVISNSSSAEVLTEQGLASYFSSLFFSPNNCLGISLGGEQQANLDDGQGVVNQTEVYRYNFNSGTVTCQESFNGGQHFRLWKQANTGAYFLAASVEDSASRNHQILPNGYNNGRDWFVGNATNSSGTTSPQDKSKYKTTVSNVAVNVDSANINHGIEFDGSVAVLTVTRTKAGNGANPTASSTSSSSSSTSSSAQSDMQTPPWLLLGCFAVFSTLLSLHGTGSADALPSGRREDHVDDELAVKVGSLTGRGHQDPLPANFKADEQEPIAIDDDLRAKLLAALPLAQSTYCSGPQAGRWGGQDCPVACDLVPGQVEVLWHAGDGDFDPHRLLLYIKDTQTLVLAVEGSTFKRLLSVLNDIVFVPLPSALPIANALRRFATSANTTDQDGNVLVDIHDALGTIVVSGFAMIHAGFQATWARFYPEAFSEVKKAFSTHKISRIITTGHSLGSAVALLDTIALRNDLEELQNGVPIENIGFGSPRVFNYVGARLLDQLIRNPDANLTSLHVHRDNDVVPHLGPLLLGFSHSEGEIFLPDKSVNASSIALSCPGYENVHCSLERGLDNLGDLSIDDHDGPYLGQLIGRNDDLKCFSPADYLAAGLQVPQASVPASDARAH